MLKKSIAFIALFTYLYPVAIIFLPLDTGRILHLISIAYIFLYKRAKISKEFYCIFSYTIPLFLLGIAATALYNDAYDFSLLIKLSSIVLYAFSAIMVVDLIAKASKSFSEYTILEWVIYAALVQAFLSFLLFFNPTLKDLYLGVVSQSETGEDIMQVQSTFRLIAVAKSQYANMAVMYGFALISAITLAFSGKSSFYNNRILFYSSLLVIFVAGFLSARTFFLLLFFAFCYFSYLLWHKKGVKVILYICLLGGFLIGIFFLSMFLLEDSEYSRTYQWAFEWYINMSETGSFETNSTNTLQSMYLFPDNLKTWWLGDGQFYNESGSFYMNTDVGYLRNLYYWGILGSISIYVVQFCYYRVVEKTANRFLLKRMCLFIILWTFAYNIKEFWFADLYWMLLLATFLKSRLLMNK